MNQIALPTSSRATSFAFGVVRAGIGGIACANETIMNNSSYAVASMVLAVTPPFLLTQNSCTGGLAAGANCAAAVTFQPATSGTATGELTVTSSALAIPASVALSGMGFDFTVAISGSSRLSVASGQTASYVVTINPSNGAQGTFTYSCGTLPANSQCVFNPATAMVGAGASGNVTLQILTGKSGAARMESPGGWRLLPLVCGLLLLPLALRRRNLLLTSLLLAVVALGVSSCTSSGGGKGGGGGGSGSGSATPAGTYPIPVSITSTGLCHVVTVTMTVD